MATNPDGIALIVEDDEELAHRVIAPYFKRFVVYHAANVPLARERIDRMSELSLALIDLNLPGGRPFTQAGAGGGFELIDRVYSRFPGASVIVLTGYVSPGIANEVHRRGAELVAKEDFSENLRGIATRLAGKRHAATNHVHDFVSHLVALHGLTARQAEVVTLAATGLRRDEIADRLGLSTNTVKTHIVAVLAASGESSLDAIVRKCWASLLAADD